MTDLEKALRLIKIKEIAIKRNMVVTEIEFPLDDRGILIPTEEEDESNTNVRYRTRRDGRILRCN